MSGKLKLAKVFPLSLSVRSSYHSYPEPRHRAVSAIARARAPKSFGWNFPPPFFRPPPSPPPPRFSKWRSNENDDDSIVVMITQIFMRERIIKGKTMEKRIPLHTGCLYIQRRAYSILGLTREGRIIL